MHTAKAVLYPIFGVLQFFIFYQECGSPHLHPNPLFPVIGIALIALGILNLKRAIEEKSKGK
jgi:hypothetical protein